MSDTTGRYIVTRHWRTRWKVQDQSWNPPRDISRPYDTQAEAEAAADRLNNPPRPQRAAQASLFDTQEA